MKMVAQRDELKAKLLAQAEAAIDRMLSDERLSEQMTLSDIEAVVGVSETEFRERVMGEMVGMQQAGAAACPRCGGRLRNKGKRSKRVVTVRGEAGIERNYYYCATCHAGHFPPR